MRPEAYQTFSRAEWAALRANTPLTLTEDRYGSVPRWYIECTLDNAVRIGRQRAMVKTLPCKVITMECGHSPFYSNPEELAEHLETIAAS